MQYTEHTAVIELVRLVMNFYLTIAFMAIGFGTMLAAGRGAKAAARFFFVRPLQVLTGSLRSLTSMVLGSVAAGAAWVVARAGRGLRRELSELGADFRWLVRRFDP